MYKYITRFLVCWGLLFATSTLDAMEITLRQCYDWALTQNEDLKIQKETVQQSQARAASAIGEAFPTLGWRYDHTWQDPSGVNQLNSEGFQGFVEKSQSDSKFYFDQPLFSGFREFSAYAGFKRESRRDELRLQRKSYEIFEDTALAFYNVLLQQTNIDNTTTALQLANDRIAELKEFVRLGKSRPTEVHSAKAYAAGLTAQLDRLTATEHKALETLSYLTGHDVLEAKLIDQMPPETTVPSLTEVLDAGQLRLDLKAQAEEVEALKYRVRYEKGYFWPRASVLGNYYTQRSTFLDKIDWDIMFSLDVPLYQGGKVVAKTNEARSMYRQSVLALHKMERWVTYYIRQIYFDLSGAVKETASLQAATDAAEQSYTALKKEYRLGLVTNLEVLQSLDFLQTQKTALDSSRLHVKLLVLQLASATEKLP